MHPVEVILALACLAPLFQLVALRGSALPGWVPLIVVLSLALDLVIAGPRWMMLPMYLAALALIWLAVFRPGDESRTALVIAWTALFLLAGC